MQTEAIELEQLTGKWHIVLTNFPMWLKGNKTEPTFNYQLETKENILGLQDIVAYQQNQKNKTIQGWDKPLDMTHRKFEWRGTGLLSLLKSRWEILYISDDRMWILIYFQKTLFTPKGYDVVHRNKILTDAEKIAILNKLKDWNLSDQLSYL